MDPLRIEKSLAAHRLWQFRLSRAAETGSLDARSTAALTDDQCEFELWLNGLPIIEKHDGHFQDVRQKHAEFHRVAASVLEAATAGRGKEAQRMLDEGGEFPKVMSEFSRAMLGWRNALGMPNMLTRRE
jgi:hypothetical protein